MPFFQSMNDAFKNEQPVAAAKEFITGPVGVRHQRADVAPAIANPGNTSDRPVGVGAFGWFAPRRGILPEDLPMLEKRGHRGRLSEVATFSMGDGNTQEPSRGNAGGKR